MRIAAQGEQRGSPPTAQRTVAPSTCAQPFPAVTGAPASCTVSSPAATAIVRSLASPGAASKVIA